MSFGSQAWGWKQQGSRQLEARYTVWHYAGVLAMAIVLGVFAAGFGYVFLKSWRPGFLLSFLAFAWLALFLFLSRLYLLVAGEPGLLLDAEGLRHPILGAVRWKDVLGLQVSPGAKNSPVLLLCLAPGIHMEGGVRWLRLPQKTTRVVIPLRGLDEPWQVIDQAANALRDQVAPPRLENWFSGMDREMVDALWEGQQLRAALQALPASHMAQGQSLLAALNANTERVKRVGDRVREGLRWQSAKDIALFFGLLIGVLAIRLLLFGRSAGGWPPARV